MYISNALPLPWSSLHAWSNKGGRVEVLHTIQELARLDHAAVFIGVLGRDNGRCVFVAHYSLCDLLILAILRCIVIGVQGLGQNLVSLLGGF